VKAPKFVEFDEISLNVISTPARGSFPVSRAINLSGSQFVWLVDWLAFGLFLVES
jgi:hypothetical protein